MNLKEILIISQIGVSILLIVSILLQQRGEALGSSFGGSGEFYGTRRGIEKKIFLATIILGIIFLGLSISNLIVK